MVLENGRPVDLSAESQSMDAIVAAWFGGEFGARAIADVLLGKQNPGGRLPISFPGESGRIPCYYSMLPGGGSDRYLEGSAAALYPFGHGLSYTTFEYSDMTITKLGDYDYSVSVKIRNTGERAGDEVVRLYINDTESSVVTPLRLLKGFERISLEKGGKKGFFSLGFDAFKLLNPNYEWAVEDGEFEIMIGAASRDIRLSQTITIGSGPAEEPVTSGSMFEAANQQGKSGRSVTNSVWKTGFRFYGQEFCLLAPRGRADLPCKPGLA